MPNVIIIETNTPLNTATTSSVSALTLAGIGTGWLITSISQSSHPANCVKDCHSESKELKLSFLSEPPILLGMGHRHGMRQETTSNRQARIHKKLYKDKSLESLELADVII